MLSFINKPSSLVSSLQRKSIVSPHSTAFKFLADGLDVTNKITYQELDKKARSIAAYLQNKKLYGERVLILYPAGIEFISAFMGCLYAGVIAVPVQVPREGEDEKTQESILSIANDADIAGVLTENNFIKYAKNIFINFNSSIPLFIADTTEFDIDSSVMYQKPILEDDTICYLQYTSGSTSNPKAAIIRHKNLSHSLKSTIKVWQYSKKSVTLTWAPHTHVYGLICGLLVPLYHGTMAIIMRTDSFILNPLQWLKAITHFGVSHSGCPNFGYDLCVKEINEKDINDLDLSHWKVAVNGGDQVQHETLLKFTEKFGVCGFKLEAFNSAYGMSEVTGAITVGTYRTKPKTCYLSSESLKNNRVEIDENVSANTRKVVSSGKFLPGIQGEIVDPEKLISLSNGEIGEIWLAGDSVVREYWQRPDESQKIFNLSLEGSNKKYFRTGDLGFLKSEELWITGRLKEIIVIYGKKYYPLDLEKSVSNALEDYKQLKNRICFSVNIENKNEVIFVQEIKATLPLDIQNELIELIQRTINRDFSIDVYSVILTKENTIPKTASGKMQRKKCEQLYSNGLINILNSNSKFEKPANIVSANANVDNGSQEFQKDFKKIIAKVLALDVAQINLTATISSYHFDSINIIKIAGAFNERFNLNITPADLFSFATLSEFHDSLLNKYEEIINKHYSTSVNSKLHQKIKLSTSDEIAVIGMSGVFPGAKNIEEFWNNLVLGKNVITHIPIERWDTQVYLGDPHLDTNKTNITWGGFIDDIDKFDADFFNISAREAELMDPQHRLLLQTVWKTIEDAGYSTTDIAKCKAGLFVGLFNHDYAELLQKNDIIDAYTTTGVAPSLLANRISYLLNLQGPSVVIDTACSSSLVAIHQAILSLQNGECEVAIAGGVNALLTPTSFISANKAGMLSEDGLCKTFSIDANGFVRSEGVASILLKPLNKALADHDFIYGVIKGTAVNHGGHANSLTAPNPNAQADVIMDACRRANISIDTLQYIEAHGTGTALGDPVEINGLKTAFSHLQIEQGLKPLVKNSCGLGSVKTHVGHLESAAGITGVIKVLLAMHHNILPANLHFSKLNPYIDITNSPFYLVNKNQNWTRESDSLARRAGISSFGFGGTNAHVILEDAPKRVIQTTVKKYLITLSAKTTVALQEKIRELHVWLGDKQFEEISLTAMSYTLNKGRNHFDKRCAFVVDSLDNLQKTINNVLDKKIPDNYVSTANDNLIKIKSKELLIDIAHDYVSGEDIDFDSLYFTDNKQRMSLPGYPFAKESYWFSKNDIKSTNASLHPLIDENVSTLECEVFNKRFLGNEFYILDHSVNGKKILPGAVYLEMARAAAKFAWPQKHTVMLKNILWLSPLYIDNNSININIKLSTQDTTIHFSINDQSTLYSQGELSYSDQPEAMAALDLKAIKARCHHKKFAEEIYTEFSVSGINYGNSFKVIHEQVSNDVEVLSKIISPVRLNEYVLHPSLMDGALQTIFALLDKNDLYVPFSIEELKVFKAIPSICYAYGNLILGQQYPSYNIQIVDERGETVVYVKNFSLRPFAVKTPHAQNELNYYTSHWIQESNAIPVSANTTHILLLSLKQKLLPILNKTFGDNVSSVLLREVESYSKLLINLKEKNSFPNIIIYSLDSLDDKFDQLEKSFYTLFNLAKSLIELKINHNIKILCVYQQESIYIESLSGFAKSLHLENPNIILRIVKCSSYENIVAELYQDDILVRYNNNIRYVKRYKLIENKVSHVQVLKKSGVYLITGGMGGLGLIFARYLAKNFQAKLILINRSPLTTQKNQIIEELESDGASVMYFQADVSKLSAMQLVISQCNNKYGALNGVIHAAGVLRDDYLLKKTVEDSYAVIAPKILGTVNLGQVTKDQVLDFFMVFSSASSVFGNIGQCDYAYANAFLDAFIEQRKIGLGHGKSISINWPLWIDGGISISEATQDWLQETLGVTSLTTAQGLAAFNASLSHDEAQWIVLPGIQDKLNSALNTQAVKLMSLQEQASFTLPDDLNSQTLAYLKEIISAETKVSITKIQSKIAFENYGIDSLMIVGLNQKIATLFGQVPKTLFFEYQNLAELTQYFIKNHAATLAKIFNQNFVNEPLALKSTRFLPVHNSTQINSNIAAEIDVAIIGLSGRYPAAANLDIFWENLKSGKDCVSTLPDGRWLKDDDKNIWGGFLEDVDKFDPLFFNISPREAESMDPQERLFLETAYNTLEDAGYSRESLASKKVGVFVGVMYGQYQLWGQEALAVGKESSANSVFSSIANRVSYFFDFHGPSMALDTMCSSSITAIHLACKSIRDGESEYAIAGGVNLSIHPSKYYLLAQGGFLSSDGRCRSFGEGGDGYVPGEGVGAVLLKSLSHAIADGDHIYAVIKGSSLNHGGKTNGYTVPNPLAQAAVIETAYLNANIDPSTISYIEAHGTGTSLGDPIEISALSKVFKADSCSIGSVKSNIGHCESAAGMAALTKVLLQLKYKKLVPSLHAQALNVNVDWENSVFQVQRELTDWNSHYEFRRAGISSFGAGGSNAHMIVEEAPNPADQTNTQKPFYLLTLSAKTESALTQRIEDLAKWVSNQIGLNNEVDLQRLSVNLNKRRSHFNKKCAFVVATVADLQLTLNSLVDNNILENVFINIHDTDKSRTDSVFKKIFKNLIIAQSEIISPENYRNNLLALANFYTDGYELDWNQLYSGMKYQKMSLPIYPFSKDRYWIPIKENNIINITEEETPASLINNIQNIFKQFITSTLKIKSHAISLTASLSELGFDSITFKELASHLQDYYKIELAPTLFFTHNSIQQLSQYLLEAYPQVAGESHKEKINLKKAEDNNLDIKDQAIAIIGMQGYFPGSDDLISFWKNIEAEKDLVTEVPMDRWDWRKNYGDAKKDPTKTNSKWGGFLSSVDQFDAGFFNISAREANLMDPQHRLFLQVVWQAIEDAGYNPLTISQQKVGLFAGIEFSEYQALIAKSASDFHGYIATGNSHSMLTNRVSYFLNLTGPSEAIDTACSSSLVAIHRAVKSIRLGECQIAVAGGVSLVLNPDTYVITSQLGALSPDGRCKTFDKSANGYVKGEGVGAILLKPLHLAEKDGDHIYGVIKATAVNHGGRAQSLTAPSVNAQSELLMEAYVNANINPASINYIETHGTGTELGDPIEVEALKLAFKTLDNDSNTKGYCALGSLKSNIGHLEPASGIASVIKVLLALHYKKIPGNLHCKELNPYINLVNSPFYLVNHTQEWKRLLNDNGEELPRRAGVSSFGFGGTNAHIVIEESSACASKHIKKQPYYLITLSAKHNKSLQQKMCNLLEWLTKNVDINLSALSYTLNTGHTHFSSRSSFVVASVAELSAALESLIDNIAPSNVLLSTGKEDPSAVLDLEYSYKSTIKSLKNYSDLTNINYFDKLMILADLYSKHYPVAWVDVYGDDQFKKIPLLPAYPFNTERYWFDIEPKITPVKIDVSSSNINDFALVYLQSVFAEKLQIPITDIEFNETYEVYGVDSVMGLDITQRLEKDFGDLPKTLLYERNNLNDLAKFFCKKYNLVLQTLSGIEKEIPVAAASLVVSQKYSPAVNSDDIAIIGLSGTYPMAKNIFELWDNLENARDCVGEVPSDRWNYRDYPVSVGGEEKYFNKGGFIPDVDKFDPLFFGIAPSDAAMMDPQERLFMQSAWTTLEDAGYTREGLQRSVNNHVGVFVGVTYNFYPLFIAEEWARGNRIPLDIQMFSIANRVSYFLNASGPSFVIDTACSSSLAAIHQACESIIRGECTVALAGGVNLSLHPAKYHMLGSLSFLSTEGRCTSFGEGGTGYVPSEGVGSMLLKPLSLALRDNDRIYGVIKASSMNHGGKTSGYTVPNPTAQAEVIKLALSKANINARTISYVEAHGTGTSLGDPIEVRGLQEAYSEYTEDKQYCALGSVKSNIGHLESAAGISQMTKVLLQLQHKKIVPSLHSKTLNPFIDFADTPFYVPQEVSDWNTLPDTPRRAGVSSFGAGGANVHVIVEEYSCEPAPLDNSGPFVFLMSAMNQDRLKEYVNDVYQFMLVQKKYYSSKKELENWLANACYTSQVARESMPARLVIVSDSFDELMVKLKGCNDKLDLKQHLVWFSSSVKVNRKFDDISHCNLLTDNKKLAEMWSQGSKIDWEQLHLQKTLSRCYLPTYPFAKRRCWVANQETNSSATVLKTLTKKWLILSDEELGFHLQNTLGSDNCIYCFAGNKYQEFSKNVFYANPDKLEDYSKLLLSCSSDIEGIIYLRTLLPDQEFSLVNQRFLYLFQALVQQKWSSSIQICLINREEENAEILQHHLWNLKDFFKETQSAHQTLLMNFYDDKSLFREADLISTEIQNIQLNKNHIHFKNAIRHAIKLENPPQFIESIIPLSQKKFTSSEPLDREHVSSLVLNALASLLAMDVIEIDPEVAFLNYGMDSIIGINFVAELNKSFPGLLSPMDLYRYPAVNELVNYILKSCAPEKLEEVEFLKPVLPNEKDFLAEIDHLDDAQVSQLLEDELRELDHLWN